MDDIRYTKDSPNDNPEKPVLFINKQIVKFPGKHIRIYNGDHQMLAMAHSLPFKLKEKIRIYGDDAKQHILATSTTKKMLDFNVTFEISEGDSGQVLGSLRRKGLASELWRDQWMIFDKDGKEIANLIEDRIHLGIIRRFLFKFIPQSYKLSLKDDPETSLVFTQTWTPLILRYRAYSSDYKKLTKAIPQTLLLGILITVAIIEDRE